MKNKIKSLASALILSASLPLAAQAAPIERTMCGFDPIGGSGPLFQGLKDYQAAALDWGVKLKLNPYTDERIASEDFKAGVCDIVNVTGIRGRSFNSFAGTIDSIGALPTYEHLKIVLDTMASKKAAKYMIANQYEVVSIVPAGAVYAFVNDRSIDGPDKLAGKRIAVMDNAPEMQILVAQAGMTPVASTLANVFSKFNNGAIDITGAPAIVYEPMELHKGLEPNGGILTYPLLQVTFQTIIRRDRFPEGFGQLSREYSASRFDDALKIILDAEERIPKKYWIQISDQQANDWVEIFRQNRLALRDEGIYNAKALTLFRKIRCSKAPELAECTATDKE